MDGIWIMEVYFFPIKSYVYVAARFHVMYHEQVGHYYSTEYVLRSDFSTKV